MLPVQLISLPTPADGSCLFHAILAGFFLPYQEGTSATRRQLARELRRQLATRLGQIAPGQSVTYYQLLNRGQTAVFAEAVPQFRLEAMQRELDSDRPLGYGFFEFLGLVLDKDIYVLDGAKGLYPSDEFNLSITGRRPSLIIQYQAGHYETVAWVNERERVTHFAPTHRVIRMLRERYRAPLS